MEEDKKVGGDVLDTIIGFTKITMDRMLKEKKCADIIALYSFYYYTAKWQKTNRAHATIGYCAKGLKMNRNRISTAKNALSKLGLIQDVEVRDGSSKIKGHYVQVYYILNSVTEKKIIECMEENQSKVNHSNKSDGVVLPYTNALGTSNINSLGTSNINSLGTSTSSENCKTTISSKSKSGSKSKDKDKKDKDNKGSMKILGEDTYGDLARQLRNNMIANNFSNADRIGDHSISNWSESIRKLIEIDGIAEKEVEKAIVWCGKNKYWKDVYLTGDKLRDKYPQIAHRIELEQKEKKWDVTADVDGKPKVYKTPDRQLKRWLWRIETGKMDGNGPGDNEYRQEIEDRKIVLTDEDRKSFEKGGL